MAAVNGAPPLYGVDVLDLSGDMGAYGTRLLALAGARVVKVEPPEGDRQRRRPPFKSGESLEFAHYNAGKLGVAIDLKAEDAEATLQRLAGGFDAVLIAPSPKSPVPGWDPIERRLSWADPASIICCLTSYGFGGPDDDLRATHLTSFALSGQMQSIGPAEGPPRGLPGNALYDELSAHAATLVIAALRERSTLGPQVIELSLHDLLAYRDSVAFAVYGRTRAITMKRSTVFPSPPPTGIWETKDGQVEFLVYNPPHWDGFVELAGRPEALRDPALRDRAERGKRMQELLPIVEALMRSMTTEEIVGKAQELRVPCAPRLAPAEVARDPQFAARGFYTEYRHPTIGTFQAPGLPFLSDPPLLRLPERPAPRLGEHNAELLEARAAEAPENGAAIPPSPSVTGLKVLSFGTAIAGNVSATLLAEMGADVVKIESPSRPDPLRAGPINPRLARVFEPSGVETNIMFSAYSRSCRSLALDMKNPDDKETFLRLVAEADVLIDNFATGVMASWGLDHHTLAERNPRLIMLSVCGYGRTGPRSHFMAYGSNINSFMGLTRIWSPHGTQFDYTAVAHVLFAVFAALARRDRTGQGVITDIAQVEAGAAMFAPLYLEALNFGDSPFPTPNTVPGSVLAAVVRCAGEDRWLAVELEDGADLESAAALLECPADVEAVRERLQAWAASLTPDQAMARLQAAGLAAAAVRDVDEEFHDAQVWGRDGVTAVEHPVLGRLCYPSPFQRMTRLPIFIRRPAATLGEHTEEVLADWLGSVAARASN